MSKCAWCYGSGEWAAGRMIVACMKCNGSGVKPKDESEGMNETQWQEDDVADSYTDEDDHETAIISEFLNPGWAAECKCGWASGWYWTTAEALAASEMHQVYHDEV